MNEPATVFVIFGRKGDFSRRKLTPALPPNNGNSFRVRDALTP